MEIALLIVYAGLNALEYRRYGLYSTLNLSIGLYVIISLVNNFIAANFGFYKVGDKALFVILIAMLLIYFSSWIKQHVITKKKFVRCYQKKCSFLTDVQIDEIFENKRKARILEGYFIICCIIRLWQILSIIKFYGVGYLGQSDFEELGLSGLASHLFLAAYPIAPLMFYYAIRKRKLIPMALYVLGLGISFLSFVKYNAIFYVVLTFLFCVLMDRRLGKKLIIIFGSMIVIIFIGNYILGFMLRNDTRYGLSDYFFRLWDYVGGSMINGNHCINFMQKDLNYTAFDMLFSSLFIFFIGLYYKISGHLVATTAFPLGFHELSGMGNTSNVAGLIFNISYTGSVIFFVLFCLIQGWLIEGILIKLKRNKSNGNLMFYAMILTVNFMTFFANYFALSTIWELLVWCFIIPKILFSSWFRTR